MAKGTVDDNGKVQVDFPTVFKALVGIVSTLVISFIIGLTGWLWAVRSDLASFGEKLDGLADTTNRHQVQIDRQDERIRALEISK
jgi:hypothetical protein